MNSPHISAMIFRQQNSMRENFLKSVLHDNALDLRKYWKFREFYSAGSFSFNTDFIEFGETQRIVRLASPSSQIVEYNSPSFSSKDYIIFRDWKYEELEFHQILLNEHSSHHVQETMHFEDDQTKVFSTPDGKLVIIFVRSIPEMQMVFGLFDFIESEKKLLAHSYWLHISTIE